MISSFIRVHVDFSLLLRYHWIINRKQQSTDQTQRGYGRHQFIEPAQGEVQRYRISGTSTWPHERCEKNMALRQV